MEITKLIQKNHGRILFTTPSHSQKEQYKYDLSELEGFDNLAEPAGVILKSQLEASKIYNSARTFYLINGSTSGILASMKTVLKDGDKVLTARNCHKSVFYGFVLTGAIPVWILPEYIDEWGIWGKCKVETIEKELKKGDFKAVIITSPTYEGVCSNIKEISKICKKYGAKLIVDEAHGALFNFSPLLPETAINSGADFSVNSLHKTAGALNSAALLHAKNIESEKVQNSLNLITTSSPSYPLLCNIEACIDFLNKKGEEKIEELFENIKMFEKFDVFNNDDRTKILVKGGKKLSDRLFEEFKIEDELANSKSVLFLTGIGTTKEKLEKLYRALNKAKKTEKAEVAEENEDFSTLFKNLPELQISPKEAYNAEYEIANKNEAINRIAAEIIAPYPPGAGILYNGEIIKKYHLKFLPEKVKVLK